MGTEAIQSCFVCGGPADRGPYQLRLVHAETGERGASSRRMHVCSLCDTSPTMLELLAGRLLELTKGPYTGTYPTRRVHEQPVQVGNHSWVIPSEVSGMAFVPESSGYQVSDDHEIVVEPSAVILYFRGGSTMELPNADVCEVRKLLGWV